MKGKKRLPVWSLSKESETSRRGENLQWKNQQNLLVEWGLARKKNETKFMIWGVQTCGEISNNQERLKF